MATAREETSRPRQSRTVIAVPSSHLGGIGLHLVLTVLAPDDQPNLGSGGAAEYYRSIGQSALTID